MLCLGKTGTDICPISATLPYLAIRGLGYGPLFIKQNGAYLTTHQFADLPNETLQEAGVDSTGYNTHSFRTGIVTTANQMGYQMFTLRCWIVGEAVDTNSTSERHKGSL